MRFELEIELGNDAMRTFEDVVKAMQDNIWTWNGADEPLGVGQEAHVFDANGNKVGTWKISEN